ncbi:MAG: NF038122 family metalloprotease, partial [Acetobacteraceae bacterium]
MTISVTFDASVNATQQAAILAVATFFNAHFLDPVSIDIAVSFSALGPNGLGASSYGLSTYSFSDIINALTIDATSADDSTAVVSLPSSDPVTGTHSWTMTPAEAMALRLISDNGATQDDSVSFSNAASFDYDRSDGITTGAFDFFGVVAHEFTEIMGRELNAIGNNVASGGGYHPLDLFKYTSAGTREFVGSNAGYFSLDGGATALLDFNTSPNGDFGDWAASAGGDSFLAFSSSGVFNLVSLADLRVMDAIGWQVRETAPVIAALVRAVGEDGPSLSQDLLAGASDAENDALFIMNMAASVGAVGTSAVAPTLFVNGDYVLTGSTMALTAAGFAKFNALAAGQSATGILGYDVSDGILTTHNTLTLTVNGINDGPTAVADVGAATENQNVSFDVLANDTDPDVGDTKTLISLGSVMVNSANPLINGIDATNAFSIVNNQVRFDPGSSFDALAVGDTAMVTVGYTMADGQNAQSSSKLTLAVSGENDPPVITSGGGGDSATYWVRVNNSAITTVRASDVDYGDTVKFEVVGGADAMRFIIDQDTG